MTLFDEAQSPRRYDAIVVGSGITGGWAAKELCEAGLTTLVLERGKHVEHGDYPTAALDPWDVNDEAEGIFKIGEGHVAALGDSNYTPEEEAHFHVQRRTGWSAQRTTARHYVDDLEHPYLEAPGGRFDWIRGYQTGGRSLIWGRQSYRWAPEDFEMNARQGVAIDWPIRYRDLEKYYDKVEDYIGVSGRAEGPEKFNRLPDGIYTPAMEFNAVETDFEGKINGGLFGDGRYVTPGRVAHATGTPKPGRQLCQYRNRCERGCPYGGYFSSNASTLPAADLTGKLTLRPHSIVKRINYDESSGKATGVVVIDKLTKEEHEFTAEVIFLNASSMGSTAILMQSGDWANESDQLGRNIMDHHYGLGASAKVDGFRELYYKGRKPNGYYMPQYANRAGGPQYKDFIRGWGIQGGASRTGWQRGIAELRYGGDFKNEMMQPGGWEIGCTAFGEVLPHPDNRMTLSGELDQWGLPKLRFDTKLRENELAMRKAMKESTAEMFERAGYRDAKPWDRGTYAIGLGIHEMGTARMGHDPKTSVLDRHNRVHAAKNVYVTDGACMTSSGTVNPSLTYMALTVRAVAHYVETLNG